MRMYRVPLLLFFSGLCALIYQMVWFREMRLVFGASTPASAAVLAIFMGGLGVGGAVLGKVADRKENPLAMYAHLELAVSGLAALSLLLLPLIRTIYLHLGGSVVLGDAGANGLRLVLATLILGAPTFLMGGTLPAAVRAMESAEDAGRRYVGLLYGLNTLGAVTGTALATFFFLEILGSKNTLICAALVNVLVGVVARQTARVLAADGLLPPARPPRLAAEPREVLERAAAPRAFVYAAALIVGFAFFLMELVWYRLLAPILGGSTYTFGLILAVALFGIGLGGALYALRERHRQATLVAFALSCGLEALFMVIPYALGDRLASTAALIMPLRALGLSGQVFGWTLITAITVLPASIVAGYQFPLLINLLGRGERDVGRHIGFAYAWNTLGAILGSLAGGFGIFPLITATGTWLGVLYLLTALGLAAWLIVWFQSSLKPARIWPVLIIFVLTVGLTLTGGPTAAWRQSPIGAGRLDLTRAQRNDIQNWKNRTRRATIWQADGREVTVGINRGHSLSFLVNGKSDGNAVGDGATQVMLGLLGAALHPEPKTSFVIGLGTGSSAGWLAEIQSMEKVDVAELEPAVLEMARRCGPVNQNVLDHPKVNVIIADARELLLASNRTYDVIASEPSNPYRAGIASLYTQEFYQSLVNRLNPGGIFCQWVQAYEIDTQTFLTIYATLGSVFPHIEVWQTKINDLLFICSMKPIDKDVDQLGARLAREPYRSAMTSVWGAAGVEVFFAHAAANADFSRAVVAEQLKPGNINLDDRMLVEYGFARTVGKKLKFHINDVRRVARDQGRMTPRTTDGSLDQGQVLEHYLMMFAFDGLRPPVDFFQEPQRKDRARAYWHYIAGNPKKALEHWRKQDRKPVYPMETAMVAELLAERGDPKAPPLIERLETHWPASAHAIAMRYHRQNDQPRKALDAFAQMVDHLRSSPWSYTPIIERALDLGKEMAKEEKEVAEEIFNLLQEPFAVATYHEKRLDALYNISLKLGCLRSVEVIEMYEPHVPWIGPLLTRRSICYEATKDPRAEAAERDRIRFNLNDSRSFTPWMVGSSEEEGNLND